ncbi:MAG TPA: ribosome biogenesis GTPase Der [Thermotogota bacterium]|nr:ribosome biogenesis GTPase Der [Thermotogota bacterium]HRW91721.1 ribosome biogenesis GTPase Der [Thermotogota bacterium]
MSQPGSIWIVGKPNVGKSTLFNQLIRKKKSIVDDSPGVTRDAVYGEVRLQNRTFQLIDTCGLFQNPQGEIESKMWQRTIDLLSTQGIVLFLVDGQTGPTAEDFKVAEILRQKGAHVLLVVNKSENPRHTQQHLSDFYEMGFGDPFFISAAHRHGLGDLLETVEGMFPEPAPEEESVLVSPEVSETRVALVGKPNVGKSLLFNRLVQKDRSMVTSIPGTTRDTIDEIVSRGAKSIRFMDTAGLRKRNRVEKYSIESFSMIRTRQAIESSDVCLLLMDATEPAGEQDKKIAGMVEKAGRASVILFNKMDLRSSNPRWCKEQEKTTREDLYFIDYSPILFVSAKTGTGVEAIWKKIEDVSQAFAKKFSTGEINRAMEQIQIMVASPRLGRKRLKIYYATQVDTRPPLIQCFVNEAADIPQAYKKAVKKHLRNLLGGLEGSPLFLKFTPRR